MPDLGSAKYTLYTDSAPFDKGMAEAEATAQESTAKVGASVDKTAAKAESAQLRVGKKMQKLSGDLAEKVALPIVAVGALAVDLANKADDASRLAQGVFGKWTSAVTHDAAQQGLAVNMTGGAYTQLETQIGVSAKAAGLHGKSMVTDVRTMAQEAGNMAVAYSTSTATITSAIQSAASGRAMALKKYGIQIDSAGEKEYALAHGIGITSSYLKEKSNDLAKTKTDQMLYTAAVKKDGVGSTQARAAQSTLTAAKITYGNVLKGTGLTLTQQAKSQAVMGIVMAHAGIEAKRAAKMHHTLGYEMEHAKVQAEDLLVKLGNALIPVLSELVGWVSKAVVWLGKHTTVAHYLAIGLGILAGVIIAVYTAIKIHNVYLELAKIKETLFGGAVKETQKAQEIQTATTEEQSGAMEQLTLSQEEGTVATEEQTGAMGMLDAVMDANPVMLVVLAIIALVAIMYELYEHVHAVRVVVQDAFHVLIEAFDAVKAHWKIIVGAIILLFAPWILAIIAIATHWHQIMNTVIGIWHTIKGAASAIWGAITSAISGAISTVWSTIQSVWNQVENFFNNTWNNISEAITGIPVKIIGIITGAGTALYNAAKALGGKIVTGIMDALGGLGGAIRHGLSSALGSVGSIGSKVSGLLGLSGGGFVQGPDTGGRDSVLAMLAPGELVLNKMQQAKLSAALQTRLGAPALNVSTGGRGAAVGARSGGGSAVIMKGKLKITNWKEGLAEFEGDITDAIDRYDDWKLAGGR